MMPSAIFQAFLNDDTFYKPDEIDLLFKDVRKYFEFSYTNKKLKYYNVPCAFDIETSSFFENEEKRGIMFMWQICIYGRCIVGRTWEQFEQLINDIVRILDLHDEKRIVFYVHNLEYEFQFIRKHFKWTKVFAITERRPIYAVTDNGVEFRCSYILTNMKLEKVGENLKKYVCFKKTGDLDYSKIRHSETPISTKEIGYGLSDVKVVTAHIMECIEEEKGISGIPLTNTGYVRRYVRNHCFYPDGIRDKNNMGKYIEYHELMDSLVLTLEEFEQMQHAFQGGFTHANSFSVGRILNDVVSVDFTSSYIYVLLSEKFPMSKPELVEVKNRKALEHEMKYYACIFDIDIVGLEEKEFHEHYLSRSKCRNAKNCIVENGRVVSADSITTTITDVDWKILKAYYKWKKIRIRNFRRMKKDYLPTEIILSALHFYNDKTKLKDIIEKASEYMRGKNMLNSIYGMMVTNVIKDLIVYDNEWKTEAADKEKLLDKYNKSASRFLYYPWGVWITAYARYNLFTGISYCRDDYHYSDTDSLKLTNYERYLDYFSKYEKIVIKKLKAMCEAKGIDFELCKPKNIEGQEKLIGIWSYEGKYDLFKTMGAKRYAMQKDGELEITVAGLPKSAAGYIMQHGGLDFFDNDMYIPPDKTDKLCRTYLDFEYDGEVIDYLGNRGRYHELTGSHMMPTSFEMSMSQEFIDYLIEVRE